MTPTTEELIALSTQTENILIHQHLVMTQPVQADIQQPMQPMQQAPFIDVHTFDYTYADKSFELDMNAVEKETWIRTMSLKMTHPIAVQGVHMILSNMDHDANLDRTNKIRAEDILVKLSQYVLQCDESFLPLIEEQIIDMVQLGQCAQGRTTRLWQLYCSLPKK
jgi:hypothetical protein